jgi:hypothetical protein
MDHHYHQPIWPLLEGAFDYTMNLAGELWTMIWRPIEQPRKQPIGTTATQGLQRDDEPMTARSDAKWSGKAMKACPDEDPKG